MVLQKVIMVLQKSIGIKKMKTEKRNKRAMVRARITDDKKRALDAYCKDNNIKVTKIIDDFLSELLKDYLK